VGNVSARNLSSDQEETPVTDQPPHNWFLGEPYRVSMIGAPVHYGQRKVGTELGPTVLRGGKELENRIKSLGWDVRDEGDIDVPTIDESNDPVTAFGMRRSRTDGLTNQILHEKVYQCAKEGRFVLTLGGDHSIGVGSISAMLRHRPDTCVVWVDAHADINTERTSPSGNIHGMPVGFLSRLIQIANCPGWEWLNQEESISIRENGKERTTKRYRIPTLRPEKIVYIGLRDVDPGEKATLKKLGIRAFSMYEIDRVSLPSYCVYIPSVLSLHHILLPLNMNIV
jgi:arginase